MEFFKNQRCDFDKPVVTMGTFDGVHLGHQQILRTVRNEAIKNNVKSVVISYFQHPLETIHKKTFPYILTERNQKETFMKKFGVDCVLYLNFNEKMANMNAFDFFKKVIIDEIGAQKIIVGYDTHFGKYREGNFELLQKYALNSNLNVEKIHPFKIDNTTISSSLIRDFIREGDMQKSAKFLGRNYSIFGTVVAGHRIGRTLGFPTINIKPADENKLIPAIGVYICKIRENGKECFGITNIGYAPTLKKMQIKEIETHILNFNDDLYHQTVEVEFLQKLRDEQNFQNENELIEQIKKDVRFTEDFFKL